MVYFLNPIFCGVPFGPNFTTLGSVNKVVLIVVLGALAILSTPNDPLRTWYARACPSQVGSLWKIGATPTHA